MTVGQTANATYSAGAWTFYLQASNSGSQTLNGVYFVNEFAWDLNNANNAPGTELALGWNPKGASCDGQGNWSLGSSGESFSVGSVSGPGMTLKLISCCQTQTCHSSANAFFGGQQAGSLAGPMSRRNQWVHSRGSICRFHPDVPHKPPIRS